MAPRAELYVRLRPTQLNRPVSAGATLVQQERAYTSAIWYAP